MRADRLLAILMILQSRGRVTARQLAQELEVSERTIYRDVIALNSAGIPVYTEGGPGGGIELVERYRTDLTGLRAEEVEALSMLNIPEPLVRLGVGPELKGALLKLAGAVSPRLQEKQQQARARIHLDSAWWFQGEDATPCLPDLQEAVWGDWRCRIAYRGDFRTRFEAVIEPYGLVAKASIWHLVFRLQERMRVLRVSQIEEVVILSERFKRAEDFDLAEFWRGWCEQIENEQPRFEVTALVASGLAERLAWLLKENQPDLLNTPPGLERQGWKRMSLNFESFESARTRLLGFGGAVEVLEPLALRYSLADYARQIGAVYGIYSEGQPRSRYSNNF